MEEWISMTEKWPIEGLKVTVKMGDRQEIAVRYQKEWTFTDRERITGNPITEQITHWKPGRWLK